MSRTSDHLIDDKQFTRFYTSLALALESSDRAIIMQSIHDRMGLYDHLVNAGADVSRQFQLDSSGLWWHTTYKWMHDNLFPWISVKTLKRHCYWLRDRHLLLIDTTFDPANGQNESWFAIHYSNLDAHVAAWQEQNTRAKGQNDLRPGSKRPLAGDKMTLGRGQNDLRPGSKWPGSSDLIDSAYSLSKNPSKSSHPSSPSAPDSAPERSDEGANDTSQGQSPTDTEIDALAADWQEVYNLLKQAQVHEPTLSDLASRVTAREVRLCISYISTRQDIVRPSSYLVSLLNNGLNEVLAARQQHGVAWEMSAAELDSYLEKWGIEA